MTPPERAQRVLKYVILTVLTAAFIVMVASYALHVLGVLYRKSP